MSKRTEITHKNIIDYFRIIVQKNRIAHAYLFIGKEGIGKNKTARYIAMLLNCESNIKPCLECNTCFKIMNDSHPDIIEITPKNSIGIKEIKNVKDKVYIKNFLAQNKIIIINQADKLTPDAANAFLKMLEEPPGNTIFFLLTSKLDDLFPTIKSRVHKLWVRLKDTEAKEYLSKKEYAPDDIDRAMKISENNLEFAERLLSKKLSQKRNKIFSNNGYGFFINETKRDNLKETVFLLLGFLRDCITIKSTSQENILNSDLKEKIIQYQKKFSVEKLISKIDELYLVNKSLDNININLANNLIRNILR